jgi:hypothetical protein
MPWTYTTLKQMIQDTCEYEETTFVAHLDDFIRAGEERIMQSVELDIFRKNVSGNITAGTTWLGTNAEQALLYACLIEAYIYMKGEADVIAMYSQRYSEALLRLKNYAEGRENVDSFREGLVRTKAT